MVRSGRTNVIRLNFDIFSISISTKKILLSKGVAEKKEMQEEEIEAN
jgi:hypothetical protein